MAKAEYLEFKRSDRLTFLDLVVLRVIVNHYRKEGVAPTKDMLFHRTNYTSMVNDWISENEVERIYVSPLASSEQLDESLFVLRRLGYILPKGLYTPTQKGIDMINQYGKNWQKYPISVPINDSNELLWSLARFAPEF